MERHLNGRKQIPLDEWKHELSDLKTQRAVMFTESEKLAGEIKSAEAIKRYAESLIGVDVPKPNRSNDLDI